MYFLPDVWKLFKVAITDTAAIVLMLDGFIWKKKQILLHVAFACVLSVMKMKNVVIICDHDDKCRL